MYFNKIHHPANFRFCDRADPITATMAVGDETFALGVTDLGDDVFRVTAANTRWSAHGSDAELTPDFHGKSRYTVNLHADGSISVAAHAGARANARPLIAGRAAATFGVSGQAWLFQFGHRPGYQFYGLGENSRGLEKSGQRAKFWNTDLFGDFYHDEIRHSHPNPMYVAIPWLIVKEGNRYVGILVNNPGAVFMDLASEFIWRPEKPADPDSKSFYVGAPGGQPELFLIVGPTLPELTRKLQTLVGRTPRPPLWALGHHQCRWGYAGPKELDWLDQKFRELGIPCDGLWLDIDYMDGYRVFTFAPKHWGKPNDVRDALAHLARQGRRVIPIIDPGVKADPDYNVCRDGLARGVFCLNDEGQPFVGYVWPGQTYFPDFSEPDARAWWTEQVKAFATMGVHGAWLDMNDPSIGAVELDSMHFAKGTQPHAFYHNQYAFGMAKASHAGFLAARPDERPFLLSRSAYISSGRYTAVWCGDNVSNWHHLRMTIPVTLGLALSGIPFNGSDVCGFYDSTNSDLAVAWYKTAFLFPFVRNHTMFDSRAQEPWNLGRPALAIITRYIRLRYKLLPYLYQLFVDQEARGEAILRPLFHDFDDSSALRLGQIADQFMVGPAIMQAPVIEEGKSARPVVLPGKGRWFSAADGRWHLSGRRLPVKCSAGATPLFFREGALVPMQVGERRSQTNNLGDIELHCFLRPDTKGRFTLSYRHDDGASFAYRRGEETTLDFTVWVEAGQLVVSCVPGRSGHTPVKVRVAYYAAFSGVRWLDPSGEKALVTKTAKIALVDRPLPIRISVPATLATPL